MSRFLKIQILITLFNVCKYLLFKMQTFKRLFIENYFKVLLGDFDLTQPAPAEAERQKVSDQNPELNN